MKYVKLLPTVEIVDLFGETIKDNAGNIVTLSMKSFILQRLLDPKFGANMETLTSASQIRGALKDAEDYVALETKDWELLADVTKNPSPQSQYNTNVAHCLLDYMKAIINPLDSLKEN